MKNENMTNNTDGQFREDTHFNVTDVACYTTTADAVSTDQHERKSMTSVHATSGLKPTTYTETLVHMFKGNIGCGILALGMAYKNGGIIFSTILIIVVGIISIYNQYTLILMANDFQKQYNCERMSYSETAALAFKNGPRLFKKSANLIKLTIEIFIIATQLGFCCVYFMFVSESLNQIFGCYDIHINPQIFMVIILPIFWLTSLIRQLKYIVPLSALANTAMLASFALILYRSMFNLPAITDRRMIGDWRTIPLCFGTIIYSLEGIGLVLPLQQNMKQKERFLGPFGVLNLSLSMVVILIILIGFFGYYQFGDDVKDTLTRNLDAKNDIITQIVIVGMILGILCTYALQFFIPVLLIMPAVRKWTASWPWGKTVVYECIVRSLLVLMTFSIAELIPHLDLVVSLVGAVGSSFLALVFVPVADLVRRQKSEYGFWGWRITLSIISLLIGILGFFVGTVVSVNEIIIAVRKDLNITS